MEFSKEEWLRHARFELELVKEEPDLIEFYLKVIDVFSDYNHNEKTLYFTPNTINRLIRHKNMTALTSNPNEWTDLGSGLWRNKRDPSCYSNDNGRTTVEFPGLDSNSNSNLIHNGLPDYVNEKIQELKDL